MNYSALPQPRSGACGSVVACQVTSIWWYSVSGMGGEDVNRWAQMEMTVIHLKLSV